MAVKNKEREDYIRAKFALGALFLLFGYVVYRAVLGAFGWHDGWFMIVATLLAVFFVAISLIGLSYRHSAVRRGYWLVSYWSGWIGVFFGAAILLDMLEHLALWTDVTVAPDAIGFTALGVAAIVIIYGTWQSTRVQVSHATIALPSLPEHWQDKTVVFASDLHLGNVHDEHFARRVASRINALAPEAVFIGGDLYDGVASSLARDLIAPFRELHAPHGVYYVSGNHEYFQNHTEDFWNAIRDAGMMILDTRAIDLRGITLAGVDYQDAKERDGFDAALAGMAILKDRPSILLKHVPEHLDIAEKHGVSLVISGHTHNGQIWPLNYCGYLFKEFYYGHHHLNGTQIYVSSGAGTQGAPFRLGTRSEIVAITLVKKPDASR